MRMPPGKCSPFGFSFGGAAKIKRDKIRRYARDKVFRAGRDRGVRSGQKTARWKWKSYQQERCALTTIVWLRAFYDRRQGGEGAERHIGVFGARSEHWRNLVGDLRPQVA